MITLRRDKERHRVSRYKQDVCRTFYPQDLADPLANGFGALESFNEDRFPPGAGLRLQPRNYSEVITYVLKGALAQEDSTGRSGVIHAGEFQRLTAARGVRHSDRNASRTEWAHIFQIRLYPLKMGLDPSVEQKRFSAAELRDGLCIVASPDGRKGSLCVNRDALIYSAILDPGKHLVHELPQGRIAWLHVVRGEATLGDLVLSAGDGVGVTAEAAVSVTAREQTEILLVDLES